MKRISFILLIIATSFVFFSCVPNEETIIEEQTLVIGSPEMDGNFLDGFSRGNQSGYKPDVYDGWARQLLHGYETYSIEKHGKIVLNETVVDELFTEVDEITGNKTYTFNLHNDLYWSDGENITAKDYVFSLLMQASIDWQKLGSSYKLGDKLLGYEEYRSGDSSEGVKFEGVILVDEYTFSLTIDSEFTPLFYETLYISLKPLPFHILTPENTIIDSDFTGSWIEAGGFSLLEQAASVSGYRYFPEVTSGPYKFVSFINKEIILEINDQFKGNFEGKKPVIENIIIKEIDLYYNGDLVINGEIDLVSEIIEETIIEAAIESPYASVDSFERNGYGMLAFAAHFGPTVDYRVRQAITHAIFKDDFFDSYPDYYNHGVESEYGKEQWMAIESEQWIEDNFFDHFRGHSSIGNDILDTTEWIYEADGVTPFDRSLARYYSEYYRYNAEGEMLEIHHFSSLNSTNYDDIYNSINNSLQSIGINYTLTFDEYQVYLDHYYYTYDLLPEEKQFHMFNAASNFTIDYDPFKNWHSSTIGTYCNPNQLEDSITNPNAPLEDGEKTLDELTVLMREVEPGDYDTYLSLWKEYQLRWYKLAPNIPTYTNQYFTVFDSNLKGVDTTPYWDWTYSIYDMYYDDTPEE